MQLDGDHFKLTMLVNVVSHHVSHIRFL